MKQQDSLLPSVLVTRPAGQARGLIAGLSALGCTAEHIPAIRIAPPPAPIQQELLRAEYDLIFFISPAAVAQTPLAVAPEHFKRAKIFAPGSGTAATIKNRWNLTCAVQQNATGAVALLELADLQQIAGQRALIVRGVGGNEYLAQELQRRGAKVSELVVYQRLAAAEIASELPAWLKKNLMRPSVAIVTSAEALEKLQLELSADDFNCLQRIPLVVASERMVKRAESVNWQAPIFQAAMATDASLLQAVDAALQATAETTVETFGNTMSDNEKDQASKNLQTETPAEVGATPSAEEVAEVLDQADTNTSDEIRDKSNDASERADRPVTSSEKSAVNPDSPSATDNAAESTVPPPIPPAATTAAQSNNSDGKQNKSGRGIALLALLLALLALGAAAYIAWFGNNQINAAKTEAAVDDAERLRLEDSIANLRRDNERLTQDLRAQGQGREALRTKIESASGRQDLIDSSLTQIRAQLGGSRRAWLEAEVAYLLRFAHERLQLNGDFATAQRALEAADQRILEMGDPGLFPVRAKISQATASLQSVKQPDVSGMSLKLNTWLGKLPALPLRDVEAHPDSYSRPDAQPVAQAADVAEWRKAVSDLWAEMKTLVQVRSDESPYELIPKIEDEFFIRQNLRLQLESARIALLQRDSKVFKASLQTAQEWLQRYYAMPEPTVAGLNGLLNSWLNTDLDPARPDVSEAFDAMRQIMDQRDDARRNAVPVNAASGGAQ